jgi:hypothetical protein
MTRGNICLILSPVILWSLSVLGEHIDQDAQGEIPQHR